MKESLKRFGKGEALDKFAINQVLTAREVMPQQFMALKAPSARKKAVHYAAWQNSTEKKPSAFLCPPVYEKMPSACNKSVGAAA